MLTRLLYFDPHPLSPLISSRAHSRLDFLFTLWKTVLGILFPILAPSAPIFFGVYLFVGSFVFFLLRFHWLPYYRLYLNQLCCAFAAVHFYGNLLLSSLVVVEWTEGPPAALLVLLASLAFYLFPFYLHSTVYSFALVSLLNGFLLSWVLPCHALFLSFSSSQLLPSCFVWRSCPCWRGSILSLVLTLLVITFSLLPLGEPSRLLAPLRHPHQRPFLVRMHLVPAPPHQLALQQMELALPTFLLRLPIQFPPRPRQLPALGMNLYVRQWPFSLCWRQLVNVAPFLSLVFFFDSFTDFMVISSPELVATRTSEWLRSIPVLSAPLKFLLLLGVLAWFSTCVLTRVTQFLKHFRNIWQQRDCEKHALRFIPLRRPVETFLGALSRHQSLSPLPMLLVFLLLLSLLLLWLRLLPLFHRLLFPLTFLLFILLLLLQQMERPPPHCLHHRLIILISSLQFSPRVLHCCPKQVLQTNSSVQQQTLLLCLLPMNFMTMLSCLMAECAAKTLWPPFLVWVRPLLRWGNCVGGFSVIITLSSPQDFCFSSAVMARNDSPINCFELVWPSCFVFCDYACLVVFVFPSPIFSLCLCNLGLSLFPESCVVISDYLRFTDTHKTVRLQMLTDLTNRLNKLEVGRKKEAALFAWRRAKPEGKKEGSQGGILVMIHFTTVSALFLLFFLLCSLLWIYVIFSSNERKVWIGHASFLLLFSCSIVLLAMLLLACALLSFLHRIDSSRGEFWGLHQSTFLCWGEQDAGLCEERTQTDLTNVVQVPSSLWSSLSFHLWLFCTFFWTDSGNIYWTSKSIWAQWIDINLRLWQVLGLPPMPSWSCSSDTRHQVSWERMMRSSCWAFRFSFHVLCLCFACLLLLHGFGLSSFQLRQVCTRCWKQCHSCTGALWQCQQNGGVWNECVFCHSWWSFCLCSCRKKKWRRRLRVISKILKFAFIRRSLLQKPIHCPLLLHWALKQMMRPLPLLLLSHSDPLSVLAALHRSPCFVVPTRFMQPLAAFLQIHPWSSLPVSLFLQQMQLFKTRRAPLLLMPNLQLHLHHHHPLLLQQSRLHLLVLEDIFVTALLLLSATVWSRSRLMPFRKCLDSGLH